MRTASSNEERVVELEARVAELERENEWLRGMSSAGFARGRIKSAPRIEWPVKAEREDLL